jgi:uncharacterized protein
MQGNVSHLEIGSKSASASRDFFEAVFGWRFNPMGEDGSGWFQAPSIRVGLHGDDPQPQIFVCFDAPELSAAIAKVKAAGGEASEPRPPEPGFGRFSFCTDPQGIRFGLHEVPTIA